MSVLAWGLGLFACAIGIHVFLLRMSPKATGPRTLYVVWTGTLAVGGTVALWMSRAGQSSVFFPDELWEYLNIFTVYVALGAAYRSLFLALDTPSPTLEIVLAVHKSNHRGLDVTALDELINDERCVKPRIAYLLTTGLVAKNGGRFRMTRRGRAMLGLTELYRMAAGTSDRISG